MCFIFYGTYDIILQFEIKVNDFKLSTAVQELDTLWIRREN